MGVLEIWPGSRLVLDRLSGGEPILHSSADPTVLYFLLMLMVLAIIIYGRIAEALVISIKLLVGGVNLKNIQSSKHKNDSVTIGFLISVPFWAFVFFNTEMSAFSYWAVFGSLAAYFFYKAVLFRILSWAVNKKETFLDVEKASNAASFLLMVFSLPALIPQLLMDNVSSNIPALYVIVVAIVLLFIYFVRINKIFISSGLSGFFRILYLCALEILPIMVLVKAVFLTNAN